MTREITIKRRDALKYYSYIQFLHASYYRRSDLDNIISFRLLHDTKKAIEIEIKEKNLEEKLYLKEIISKLHIFNRYRDVIFI